MPDIDRQSPAPKMPRLGWLDALRGIALITMATYHFTWDLDFFHYVPAGTAYSLPMRLYAHAIASTFLFLAGASLFLAHANGIRWQSFGKRFAKIVAAAALVTIATYFSMPDEFIYFGILHEIALASLIGLVFLRVPALLTLAVAVFAIAAPFYLRGSFFDVPPLYWVGLSNAVRRSNDYVPMLPWIGPFLVGIACFKILIGFGRTAWLEGSRARNNPVYKGLSGIGRHSLAFYLLHQPVMFGLVWCFAQVLPAASPDQALSYMNSCKSACVADRGESFCQSFCACTLTELKSRSLFNALENGEIDVSNDERVTGLSRQCTISAQEQK